VEPASFKAIQPRKRTREGDLRGALKNDNKNNRDKTNRNSMGKPSKKIDAAKEKTAETTTQDFQLQRALDLLRGVSMFSQRIKG
jgi:hypothetical protein